MIIIKTNAGQLETLTNEDTPAYLRSIKISAKEPLYKCKYVPKNPRLAALWINEKSLSYLTIDNLLDLKEEINDALESMIK